MQTQFISQRIDKLRVRINAMFKQLREPQENASEALEQSFVELVSALEELQVADEALSQQVNELTTVKMELERERQRYQSLFQFLEDGYLITDKDGKIQEANAAASAFFLRPIREIIGKPITIFIHDDDRHFLRSQVNQVSQKQEKVTFEVRVRSPHAANSATLIQLTAAPGFNELGEPIMLHWHLQDVTQQKVKEQEADEYLNRFRAVFQSYGVGVMLINQQGKIMESNPALLRLTGYTFAEINQLPLTDFVYLEDLEAFTTCQHALFSDQKQKCRFEGRLLRKDGSIVWVKISMSCFQSTLHDQNLIMNLVENVTEKHTLQTELAEAKKQLEKAHLELKNGKVTEPTKSAV